MTPANPLGHPLLHRQALTVQSGRSQTTSMPRRTLSLDPFELEVNLSSPAEKASSASAGRNNRLLSTISTNCENCEKGTMGPLRE
eukprot:10243276-Prorocentrum_lima.AAC.1